MVIEKDLNARFDVKPIYLRNNYIFVEKMNKINHFIILCIFETFKFYLFKYKKRFPNENPLKIQPLLKKT